MQVEGLGWHVDLLRFPAATTTMEALPDFTSALKLACVFFSNGSPNTPIILQNRPVDIKIDRHLKVALIHGIGWASRATFGC